MSKNLEANSIASYENLKNSMTSIDMINRGCCEWHVFLTSFLSTCSKLRFPAILVNRLEARQHWRSGMTGFESVCTFKSMHLREIY